MIQITCWWWFKSFLRPWSVWRWWERWERLKSLLRLWSRWWWWERFKSLVCLLVSALGHHAGSSSASPLSTFRFHLVHISWGTFILIRFLWLVMVTGWFEGFLWDFEGSEGVPRCEDISPSKVNIFRSLFMQALHQCNMFQLPLTSILCLALKAIFGGVCIVQCLQNFVKLSKYWAGDGTNTEFKRKPCSVIWPSHASFINIEGCFSQFTSYSNVTKML